MTDKQIIKKFSDNHCLVLENNQISLREDEITAYRIVLGKSTNELLEFVKDTYLQLKHKEQKCEELISQRDKFEFGNNILEHERNKYKQTLTEIKEIAENSCCLQPTSTCEEFESCKECSRTSDDEALKQILQKISEVENDR